MKKIGIIGSGNVAKALGEGFIKNNYNVLLGTRNSSKLDEWLSKNSKNAQVGSFEQAAGFGDIIVLAVKGTVVENLVKEIRDKIEGKTVIDASNPIAEAPPINGVLKFFTNLDNSLLEILQKTAPKANFVKAFNSVGSALMVNPSFSSPPSMFIAGNDKKAKRDVSEILTQFGWEPEDMGMAEAARAIEPLCMLWCIPGFIDNKWSHAFKLLKA